MLSRIDKVLSWLAVLSGVVVWIVSASFWFGLLALAGAFALLEGLSQVLHRFETCAHGNRVKSKTACEECVAECLAEELEQKRQEELEQQERDKMAQFQLILQEQAGRRIRRLDYLQSMDPLRFEHLVLEVFSNLGWDTRSTPGSGDEGIDGFLRRDGRVAVVQCKRFEGKVGSPAVRDLNGVVAKEGVDLGFLVTTGSFSDPARRWQENIPAIELVDGEALLDLIDEAFRDHDPPGEFAFITNKARIFGPDLPPCPRCERPTRTVRGRHGPFIGCTSYPNCDWTCELDGASSEECENANAVPPTRSVDERGRVVCNGCRSVLPLAQVDLLMEVPGSDPWIREGFCSPACYKAAQRTSKGRWQAGRGRPHS